VRRASSTIELKDGQTFVLAGLLNNNLTTAQQQLPWIGDVPVLGALFSSKDYQKQETDLVILVTPHIVRPMRPGDPVKTPLDNTLPANDVDFFLNNQPEVLRTEVRATEAAFGRNDPAGHVLDLPRPAVVAVVDPPRKEFNVFDMSTWGSPSANARGTDTAAQTLSLVAPSTPPDPDPPKVEARVVDVPKRSAIVAHAPNEQSQVLDLPKGDGNAGAQ
jgi:hypothetical protein